MDIRLGDPSSDQLRAHQDVKIDPAIFIPALTRCWEGYGNVISPALVNEWCMMLHIFNNAINDTNHKVYSYNATMGLGKSLASQVACAVLAQQSWNPAYYFDKRGDRNTGALLVVERQNSAEEAADMINGLYRELGGQFGNPAIAKHSGNDVSFEEIQELPVLVICHSSYAKSLQRYSDGKTGQFASFSSWEHGPRRLVIIDESINPIQDYVLDHQDVHTIMGWFVSARLLSAMERDYPVEYQLLLKVADALEQLETEKFNKAESTERFHELLCDVPSANLQNLYDELRMAEVEWDILIDRKPNAQVRMERQKKVLNFFRVVDQLLYEWSFYFREGSRGYARSAQWIIPDDVGSMVILDGTADQDVIYELFGRELEKWSAGKIRRFDNVTLRVRKEKAGLGKAATSTDPKKRAIIVYDWLRENLPASKKVLICGHKAIEDSLGDLNRNSPHFQEFHVAHWGAATGSNKWKECDTVVVVSVPYRDHGWAASGITSRLGLLEGLQALQDESKESPAKKLANSKTAVDVLQLLFRCRIRKMTDADGRCEPADLYLMISNDYKGEDILRRVIAEMPGVKVEGWNFKGYSLTDEEAEKRLRNSAEGSIKAWLHGLKKGPTPAKALWSGEDQVVSRKTFNKHWKHRLLDPLDPLHQFMLSENIAVEVAGVNTGERVTFTKI